ncbi:hypothetical protein IQ781_04325 [Bacillus sp. N447-1]|uniref:hypothetical protein n=1 Tax=Bacillus TaxID=1386 RepID=UPI001F6230AB|nr:hypothetical protein [Bacillus sp. N447-1]UNT69836.1 hypothetical protein IQ781_04325 [Bacillus sp. N447-1]
MTNVQKERFDARNITKADLEKADRIIRERDYNYQVDLNILYTLRSLINDEIRNAENKREAFYQAMQRHDTRVFKRPEDFAPINIGGWPIYRYLEVLRKVKTLGGTEFDEYWSADRA